MPRLSFGPGRNLLIQFFQLLQQALLHHRLNFRYVAGSGEFETTDKSAIVSILHSAQLIGAVLIEDENLRYTARAVPSCSTGGDQMEFWQRMMGGGIEGENSLTDFSPLPDLYKAGLAVKLGNWDSALQPIGS